MLAVAIVTTAWWDTAKAVGARSTEITCMADNLKRALAI
jgi:hypothetical protein